MEPVLTPDTVRTHPAFAEQWYHVIELFPDVFTNGKKHGNLLATRSVLAGCEVEGKRCLDIGAQDGLLSLLLHRRGANHVTATDRLDLSHRLDLLREIFALEVDYFPGEVIEHLPFALRERGASPFDLVIFSGVLYHLYDPMIGLVVVRSVVRDGGLVVVETAAAVEDDALMHFNAAGRYYPGANYWMIALGCLDYVCRLLGMPIVDCAFLRHTEYDGMKIVRVAVVCRATASPAIAGDDAWMAARFHGHVLAHYLDRQALDAGGLPEVAYRPLEGTKHVMREGTGWLDLFRTVQASRPLSFDGSLMRLDLGATV